MTFRQGAGKILVAAATLCIQKRELAAVQSSTRALKDDELEDSDSGQ